MQWKLCTCLDFTGFVQLNRPECKSWLPYLYTVGTLNQSLNLSNYGKIKWDNVYNQIMHIKLLVLSWPAPQISHWSLHFSIFPLPFHSFLGLPSYKFIHCIRTTHSHIIIFSFVWRNIICFIFLLIGVAYVLPLAISFFYQCWDFQICNSWHQLLAGNLLLHLISFSLTMSSLMDQYHQSLGIIHLQWLLTLWSPW